MLNGIFNQELQCKWCYLFCCRYFMSYHIYYFEGLAKTLPLNVKIIFDHLQSFLQWNKITKPVLHHLAKKITEVCCVVSDRYFWFLFY